jgi:hypothetical protein
MIARSTSAAINDADPFGNGDQSPIEQRAFGDAGQALIDVWGNGADFNPMVPRFGQSRFLTACFMGNAAEVAVLLGAAKVQSDSGNGDASSASGQASQSRSPLTSLLEFRESMLRLNPLIACIGGSRLIGKPLAMPLAIQHAAQHARVAQLLLDAGARVDACDIAGYSVLHHCTTSQATPESLEIGALVIKKATTAVSPEYAVALVNTKNRAGNPPLFEAVTSRRIDSVNFLLHAGADPSLKSPGGVTALKLARLMPEMQVAFSASAARSAKLRGANCSTSFVGVRVYLRDLRARADLNGRVGMPKSYDPVADRYLVSLEPLEAAADAPQDASKNEAEDVNVRTVNLEPVAESKSVMRDSCSSCGNASMCELIC